jgi:hypothetical protein
MTELHREIAFGIMCAVAIAWTVIGTCVLTIHFNWRLNNWKQNAFLWIVCGPVAWIFMPCALVVIMACEAIDYILDKLED